MKLVIHFLSKYRVAAFVAVFLMFVELTVELFQPYLISIIIDEGITQKNPSVVLWWGGVLVAGSVMSIIAGILSSFYAAHASQSLGYDVRERLYVKVQTFAYAVFNRFATSSLITRLTNDVTQLQDTVFMGLRFMLRMPLVVIGSIVMALFVHVQLGLLLLLTVPALFLFVIWMMKKASGLFQRVQLKLDAVNGVMQENLTGMRLIRVFVRGAQETNRFAKHSGELMKSAVSALRLTEITMPFIVLIMNAGIIAVLWFGHLDIRAGNATSGEVVAIVNYSLRIAGALSTLSMIISAFSRGRASAQRINDVLTTDDSNEALSSSSVGEYEVNKGSIQFEHVFFSYPNTSAPVLEDISFRVRPGERIAILGATGSGKTSLMQLILRLYEEDKGTIYIDGVDARKLNPLKLHRAIGYVPQEVLLFTGTIRENISWGWEAATQEDVVEAAKLAQIHDTIINLPNGYDTILGQKGINLSGGQKQRISIARALIRKPAILLLDDSTSALDVRTEAALIEALTDMSCTTLIVTQKISSALHADLILLLDDGRLIAQGSHRELIASHTLYKRIYESQFGEEDSHVGSFK